MGNARYEAGSTTSGLISLPTGADSISLDVFDAQNRKVFTQTMGRQMPGDLKLSWNGATDSGSPAASGTYKIVATVSSLGKVTQTPISTPMTVKSVTYSPADDDLIVEVEGGATVPLSQVTRIDAPFVPSSTAGSSTAGGINAMTALPGATTPSGTSRGPGPGTTPASALQDPLKGLFKPSGG